MWYTSITIVGTFAFIDVKNLANRILLKTITMATSKRHLNLKSCFVYKKSTQLNTFTGSVGYHLAESKGFEPLTQLPVYRISSAGRYNHFDNSPKILKLFTLTAKLLTHIHTEKLKSAFCGSNTLIKPTHYTTKR